MVEEKEKQDKKTTKTEVEEKRKSQKVKVLVSIYRYGEKIVSALGIPTRDAWVIHKLDKSKLKPEELFNISSALSNDTKFKKDPAYNNSVTQILDGRATEVSLPQKRANELFNIGNLNHEILNIEIELFIK